ncbi:MAG TPA: uroporphyrinogen decarboxylase family protein [Spirochaetia bacterium]|nr:uroporphyrinogen decarboxylase family protein [Spirochaetia bacterium]
MTTAAAGMTSRERVKRAIGFGHPDRPPISHAVLPAAQIRYGKALDDILASVREDFGWEYLPDLKREDFPALYRPGRNVDDFGTVWEVHTEGVCGIPVEWPFADWKAYPSYRWPDFTAGPPGKGRQYSGHMTGPDDRWYARGGWITFFEQMQQLRGMENLLMDLAEGTREVYRLRDDLLAFNLRWLDKWCALPYDGIHFADDWGDQTRLLIRPEQWRSFFRPAYAAMFQKVISAGMDVHFHSDGNIIDIIPDLLDIGVKVINCQANVIGLELLKKRVAGSVCFRTDLDRQKIVPFGTPEQVRRHVVNVFEHLGTPAGGVIACGEIGPDTPLENIRAMYEAFASYRY